MKKLLKALLLVCIVLPVLSLPVYGGGPTEVSGAFTYTYECDEPRFACSNMFMVCTDVETWTGNLNGEAKTEYVVVFHGLDFSTGNFTSQGVFEGSVNGKFGTLEYRLTGQLKRGTEWKGTWWMGQGTGGLEGAHGQGTWWGPVGTEFPY